MNFSLIQKSDSRRKGENDFGWNLFGSNNQASQSQSFSRNGNRTGVIVLITFLSCAFTLHASHVYYWHGGSFFDTGNFNRSSNWTDGQNGGGKWPDGSKDDTFGSLNTAVWSFKNQDNSGSTGDPTVSGGEMIISSKGVDNWLWDHEYVAAYRNDVPGDFDVTVKIVSQSNTDQWAKAGLIMANDFNNLYSGGYAIVAATPQGHGVIFQWASDPAHPDWLNNNVSTETSISFPVWVRMAKYNGKVYAFYKENLSNTWSSLGSGQTLPGLGTNSQMGLFATAHNPWAVSTAKFDDFQTSADIIQQDLTFKYSGTGANSDLSTYVTENFSLKEIDWTGYSGNFNFQSYTLSVSENVSNASGYTVDEGTGAIDFTGNGTQVFIPRPSPSEMLPIIHSGTGTLKLSTNNLKTKGFTQTAGTLDLNGKDISVTSGGNFSIQNGASTTFTGLGGRAISAEGNISFEGSPGNNLNLNPTTGWTVNAGGSLTASNADIKNSSATGTPGIATGSSDQGGNSGWTFENLDAWVRSATIDVNTTGITTSTLANFPLLIRLDENNFPFEQTAPDGSDIRFSTDGTSLLAHEIESWDAANKKAVLWVKVLSVAGNAVTEIKMHWGKAGASSSSSGNAVFNNNYAAVWHMEQDPASGVQDATSYAQHGTAQGGMGPGNLVDAIGGKGYDFDGSNDYINLGTMNQDFSGGVTLCGWMNYDAYKSWSRLADIGTGEAQDNIFVGNKGTTNDMRFEVWKYGQSTLDVNNVLLLNTWKHICGTVDGSGNMKFYRNGDLLGSTSGQTPKNIARAKSYIAKSNWAADALFDGTQDEVRFSTVARSADWIKLSYKTQKIGATVVTVTPDAEDLTPWAHNRDLYINTSSSGLNVAGDVDNFPFLVKLSRLNFAFSEAKAQGEDLRFTTSSGTPLYHEVEHWDSASGEAAVWVHIPKVLGNDSTQFIKVYWGNAAAEDGGTNGLVFSTGNNFSAVWHLENTSFKDAADGFDGTGVGLDSSNIVPGVVGKAVSLNGTDEYVDIPNSVTGALNLPLNGTYTLSAWVKTDILDGSDRPIVMKGDNQYSLKIKNTDEWEFVHKTPSTWDVLRQPATTDEWVHFVGVQDGSQMTMYINGVQTGTPVVVNNGPRDESHPVHIGHNSEITSRYFDGAIDEVRISGAVRSADWVKLAYETQKEGEKSYTQDGFIDLVSIRQNLAKDYNGSEISIIVPKGTLRNGDHFKRLTADKRITISP